MRAHGIMIGLVVSALLPAGCSSVIGELGAGRFETPLITQLSRMTVDQETDEINPVWSPDASTLLYVKSSSFAGKYGIWQLDLQRRLHANLTESFAMSTLNPTWSPDGRRIAFFSRLGADYDIWTLDVSAGGKFAKLIDDEHMNIFPSWSMIFWNV